MCSHYTPIFIQLQEASPIYCEVGQSALSQLLSGSRVYTPHFFADILKYCAIDVSKLVSRSPRIVITPMTLMHYRKGTLKLTLLPWALNFVMKFKEGTTPWFSLLVLSALSGLKQGGWFVLRSHSDYVNVENSGWSHSHHLPLCYLRNKLWHYVVSFCQQYAIFSHFTIIITHSTAL